MELKKLFLQLFCQHFVFAALTIPHVAQRPVPPPAPPGPGVLPPNLVPNILSSPVGLTTQQNNFQAQTSDQLIQKDYNFVNSTLLILFLRTSMILTFRYN